MPAIVTLTTDFGYADAYVAAMKGVIMGISPGVAIIDNCHDIRPRNVSQAAFILGNVYDYFPPGTVHVAVVDPGVGTERRAVILRTPSAYFVAPDNGILSYIVARHSPRSLSAGRCIIEPASGLQAFVLNQPRYWRTPVSTTFHGRDVFAPVAAHLAAGCAPGEMGEPVADIEVLDLPQPCRRDDGALVGTVIHVDGFGNLVSCIRAEAIPSQGQGVVIEVGGRVVEGLSRAYATGGELVALIGSSGYLEISRRDGSAAAWLGVGIGTEVVLKC